MIPQIQVKTKSELPRGFAYWTPKAEDASEEGIGCCFRDVWLIMDVSRQRAESLMEKERNLAMLADRISDTWASFEAVACAIESSDRDALPVELAEKADYQVLYDEIGDDIPLLEGLDLGVAGLVYALSSIGCFPAASCRGHASDRPWSDRPVVLVAMDPRRAVLLQPLLKEAGCGFEVDSNHPELLVIEAPSIENSMKLAGLIMDKFDQWIDIPRPLKSLFSGEVHPDQEPLW